VAIHFGGRVPGWPGLLLAGMSFILPADDSSMSTSACLLKRGHR
jgi:hypothetical protein